MLLNGDEDFFKHIEGEKEYIILPNLPEDKLVIYVEDQLQTFLCDVIVHYAQEIQRLKYNTLYTIKVRSIEYSFVQHEGG